MKTKYRILQRGDRFYPQRRLLLWWELMFPGDRPYGHIMSNPIYFHSLAEAQHFLISESGKDNVKVHEFSA